MTEKNERRKKTQPDREWFWQQEDERIEDYMDRLYAKIEKDCGSVAVAVVQKPEALSKLVSSIPLLVSEVRELRGKEDVKVNSS